MSVFSVSTVTDAAGMPPKKTSGKKPKFVPSIVTAVPPLAGPVLGVISVMVGAEAVGFVAPRAGVVGSGCNGGGGCSAGLVVCAGDAENSTTAFCPSGLMTVNL